MYNQHDLQFQRICDCIKKNFPNCTLCDWIWDDFSKSSHIYSYVVENVYVVTDTGAQVRTYITEHFVVYVCCVCVLYAWHKFLMGRNIDNLN